MNDILTVFRKEWNEYLHARSSIKGTIMQTFFPILIFGIVFPLQAGKEWIESPIPILSFAWIPLLFVSALTADSFAGEKERHTFETLLASRLKDSSIFLGKLSAAVSYGLIMTVLIAGAGVVTVNIKVFDGSIVFYPLKAFFAGALICVLLSIMIAGIGIMISMRAQTVRQAHQTLSFSIVLIALTPTILLQFVPKPIKEKLFSYLTLLDAQTITLGIIALITLLNILILSLAYRKCRRTTINYE